MHGMSRSMDGTLDEHGAKAFDVNYGLAIVHALRVLGNDPLLQKQRR